MEKHQGNLLSVQRGIIVHGCNCHGVMGSGVAAAVRDTYPMAYIHYRQRYENAGLQLGDVIFVGNPANESASRHVRGATSMPHEIIVANALTQFDYGREPGRVYVDYDALEAAFWRIRAVAKMTGLPVHFPLIGCGLAGGDWSRVEPIIEAALEGLESHLWVM